MTDFIAEGCEVENLHYLVNPVGEETTFIIHADENGKYYELWTAQSQYYTN